MLLVRGVSPVSLFGRVAEGGELFLRHDLARPSQGREPEREARAATDTHTPSQTLPESLTHGVRQSFALDSVYTLGDVALNQDVSRDRRCRFHRFSSL